ncbi:uncharacterized protein TNCT_346371 [Trichonephila clavata]|uniref:Uncharacterized protein n=1 Tax=Trichonephila clavata TaxID=2740835 RepID=A0A8X6LMA0_TRICU|nr:uncharacterized protein TNCT_346371 [Trichonephila clavata]
MSYITAMRNVIKFQIESSEVYDYLKQTFKHSILFPLTRTLVLQKCLRYALSKVAEFTVLVHNYAPFRRWPTIFIEHDYFSEDDSDQSEEIYRSIDENDAADYYLVPEITNTGSYSFVPSCHPLNIMQFVENWLDNLQFKNIDCFNSMNKSIWRRLYANNFTYFCSSDIDIAAFLKEQIQRNRPISTFNEIIKRERGETFNQSRILESIASPYYYVLPHQNRRISEELHLCKLDFILLKIFDVFGIRDGILDFYCALIVDERFNFA